MLVPNVRVFEGLNLSFDSLNYRDACEIRPASPCVCVPCFRGTLFVVSGFSLSVCKLAVVYLINPCYPRTLPRLISYCESLSLSTGKLAAFGTPRPRSADPPPFPTEV